ncbi:MAG: energy transducer TonB [Acidobacteriia bacterium]|nr:energy transducer TonB [Terriglobia bacterium]
MAMTTPQKWLAGCGIGCAVLIVLVVGLVTSAIVYVRGKYRPLQEASDSRKEIVAAYGAPDTFVPPPDGIIDPGRMEAFLSVRDALKDPQARLDSALANFDFERLTRRQQSFGAVLQTLSEMTNLIVPAGEYVNQRNRVLLDKRMGLGEYAYIYSIAYYSFLGHSPAEGPSIIAKIQQRERDRPGGNNFPFSPEAMREQYRRLMLHLLRNQLDSIKDVKQTKWRGTLAEEISRIDTQMDRLAWQDNLPLPIEECLRPYRSRLEATYYPSTNFLELLTVDEFNQMQWGRRVGGGEAGTGGATDTGPVEAPEVGAGQGVGTRSGNVSYMVGEGVTAPVPISQPLPPYPEEARRARIEGVVTIQAVVRKNGTVDNLRIIHGLGHGLDESAVNTIATRWKFKPGTLKDAPVDVQARIEVRFRLN